MRKLSSIISVVLLITMLIVLPQKAYAAGASLSGKSSPQPGESVTLTLSVDEKTTGITATLKYDNAYLSLTDYACSVSGWSLVVKDNKFIASGANEANGGVLSVTFKVSAKAQELQALSASFETISVIRNRETEVELGSASWSGKVAGAPSSNCSLSAIIAGNFTLSPAFSPDTTYYTTKVPYSVSKLSLDYNRADKTQTVSISGTQLAVGLNTVTLKVTAASGATRTYTIEVTREQDPNYKPSSDATLSQLGIEGAALSPAFSSSVTDYIAYVPFETKQVTLSAAANDSKASGISGTGDIAIDKEGDNLVTVTCTAEDKTTKAEYTIHVVRMPQYTGTVPAVTIPEPDPEPEPEPEPEVPMLEIPLNVKLPLLGEVRTAVAIIGGMVLVAGLLFLLGLFIGRSTGGSDGSDGPDDPPDRDDRRSRRDRGHDRDRREEHRPAPSQERSRPLPRIVPREPAPVKKAAPPARNWADFDIPLDDDEPAAPPAPKAAPQQTAAPVRDVVEETVDRTLADPPAPKDEADVRTMSLEDLLKDIHDM